MQGISFSVSGIGKSHYIGITHKLDEKTHRHSKQDTLMKDKMELALQKRYK